MRWKLAVFLFGFTSGVFSHSFFDFGYWWSFLFLLLGVVLFAYDKWFAEEKAPSIIVAAVFLFAIGIGLLRYDISLFNEGDQVLENAIGKRALLRGIVVEEPDVRENNTRLVIVAREAFLNGAPYSIDTKILAVAPLYPEFQYGDEIEITGVLKKPENFENENGRMFDYVSYLAKDSIFYQIFFPHATLVSSGNGNKIKETLFAIKQAFIDSLGRAIPEPESSLAGGLIVGAKRSLGSEWLQKFRATGVIHIVVLSGYNITIVAEAIMRAFSFLPRAPSIFLGAFSVVLFAVMTGAGATVVRASLMALLVILARATGRVYEITIALFVAGFAMLMHNPKILVFDPSFQLSFLAALGLIYLAPQIEKYFNAVPSTFGFREFAIATVSTQIFVSPLLLYQTGQLSIMSLPVNLLILVFIPLTMLFGFLTGVIGFASTLLSLPFAFISYAFLWYDLKVVEIFSALPFASIFVSEIPFVVVVVIYCVYVAIIYFFSRKTSQP